MIEKTRIEFLSPFSVELSRHFREESWSATQVVMNNVGDCYALLHELAKRQDPTCILCGHINDLISHPRLSGYTGIHTEVIFHGTYRMKLRIVTRKAADISSHPQNFTALEKIYAPVLFRDFDLINEATGSNSQAFIESVREHVFARKIPLHTCERPLFYIPAGLTIHDSIIYLEPERFPYIQDIYRNHEKTPLSTLVEYDDIITYTFGEHIEPRNLRYESVHSGISRWRISRSIGLENT